MGEQEGDEGGGLAGAGGAVNQGEVRGGEGVDDGGALGWVECREVCGHCRCLDEEVIGGGEVGCGGYDGL